MREISFKEIHISEDRQRQEFNPEAHQELVNSITDIGLMHCPVLRFDFDLNRWILVAGERRLKAIQEIFDLGGKFTHDGVEYTAKSGKVPFSSLGELSILEAEEAELDENLKRRDLTWQEHAAAVARLHALRTNQIAEARSKMTDPGSASLVPDHTVADTAKEVTGRSDGYYQDITRKEIIVAKHLSDPSIAKAKSADEAFKILKRNQTALANVELAKKVGASFNAASHTLRHGSCLELMALPEYQAKFDVILTDPPYGMGAQSFGDGGGKFTGIEHHYDDSYESWKKLIEVWCPLSFAVAKPQAHAYVFCDIDRFHELKAAMQAAGWYVFRTPLINYKLNSGRVPLPDRGPRRQYEIILYAIKGDKPVTHIYPDVISSQSDENLSHGAQKPVAVYQNLLQRSVRPGDSVLDCFAGSGPIFEACHTMSCYATAFEQNPEYYGICAQRLERIQKSSESNLFEGL